MINNSDAPAQGNNHPPPGNEGNNSASGGLGVNGGGQGNH